jgi:hypothetical protein
LKAIGGHREFAGHLQISGVQAHLRQLRKVIRDPSVFIFNPRAMSLHPGVLSV